MQTPNPDDLPGDVKAQAAKLATESDAAQNRAKVSEHLGADRYLEALPYAVADVLASPTTSGLVRVAICFAEVAAAANAAETSGETAAKYLACAVAWFDAAENAGESNADFYTLRCGALVSHAVARSERNSLDRAKADLSKVEQLHAAEGGTVKNRQRVAQLRSRLDRAETALRASTPRKFRTCLAILLGVVLVGAAVAVAVWSWRTTTPPLPAWAQALEEPLPKTTRMMLRLDDVHRGENPLGPILAGKLRWVAADAIGCDYARQYAAADLRRAGIKDADLNQLSGDSQELPAADRPTFAFARKLTRAAHTVTDDEVAVLLHQFGPEQLVAVAHTVAYANFQNRLFLALGVEMEAGGPFPPQNVRLDPKKLALLSAPPRLSGGQLRNSASPNRLDARPDWGKRTFAELEKAVDQQKHRPLRIPLPASNWLARLPPEARAQTPRNLWAKVSVGYQPLLTSAWLNCWTTFQQEGNLPPVFASSLFWVITRTNECFY